ncbi:MAG: acyl-CoA dehydrogenase family protein [Chloroflexota bacterium]
MEFRFTKEDEEFRQEVRKFLQGETELLTKVRDEEAQGTGWGPYTREFMRKAGARGYLAPSWPKKYGGLEASYIQRHIIAEEMSYYAGRIGPVGLGIAGHVILHHGSDEQKEDLLPKIARGEIEFALGYTEPQAGSDLAALEIRAVKDGDYYVINGQKTFNTATHYANYHWLGVKTNPPAKHRGISLFIIDLKTPGITIRPLIGLGKARTNEVFYDDVRVHKSVLVGEENHGWEYILEALTYERNWLSGEAFYELDRLLDYTKNNRRNGEPIAKDPIVRQNVAQIAMELEINRLFAIRVACIVDKGKVPTYESSMVKLFGSEAAYRAMLTTMKIMGPYGQLDRTSKHAVENGRINRTYYNRATRSILTAGTSEIQRNIIALQIGLPRG